MPKRLRPNVRDPVRPRSRMDRRLAMRDHHLVDVAMTTMTDDDLLVRLLPLVDVAMTVDRHPRLEDVFPRGRLHLEVALFLEPRPVAAVAPIRSAAHDLLVRSNGLDVTRLPVHPTARRAVVALHLHRSRVRHHDAAETRAHQLHHAVPFDARLVVKWARLLVPPLRVETSVRPRGRRHHGTGEMRMTTESQEGGGHCRGPTLRSPV